jgi:hypothetical protein
MGGRKEMKERGNICFLTFSQGHNCESSSHAHVFHSCAINRLKLEASYSMLPTHYGANNLPGNNKSATLQMVMQLNDAVSNTNVIMISRIWNVKVVAIINVLAAIRTEYLPNTNVKPDRYINLLDAAGRNLANIILK